MLCALILMLHSTHVEKQQHRKFYFWGGFYISNIANKYVSLSAIQNSKCGRGLSLWVGADGGPYQY